MEANLDVMLTHLLREEVIDYPDATLLLKTYLRSSTEDVLGSKTLMKLGRSAALEVDDACEFMRNNIIMELITGIRYGTIKFGPDGLIDEDQLKAIFYRNYMKHFVERFEERIEIPVWFDEIWYRLKSELGGEWLQKFQQNWKKGGALYWFAKGNYDKLDEILPGLGKRVKEALEREMKNIFEQSSLDFLSPVNLRAIKDQLGLSEKTLKKLEKFEKMYRYHPLYRKYFSKLKLEHEALSKFTWIQTEHRMVYEILTQDEVWKNLKLKDRLIASYRYFWDAGMVPEKLKALADGYLRGLGLKSTKARQILMGTIAAYAMAHIFDEIPTYKHQLCGKHSLCLYANVFFSPQPVYNFPLQTDKVLISPVSVAGMLGESQEKVEGHLVAPCMSDIIVKSGKTKCHYLSANDIGFSIHSTLFYGILEGWKIPENYYVSIAKLDESKNIHYLKFDGFEFKDINISVDFCLNLTGKSEEEYKKLLKGSNPNMLDSTIEFLVSNTGSFPTYYECAEAFALKELYERVERIYGNNEERISEVIGNLFLKDGYTLSITKHASKGYVFCGDEIEIKTMGTNQYWCFTGENTFKKIGNWKIVNWRDNEDCIIRDRNGEKIGRLEPLDCMRATALTHLNNSICRLSPEKCEIKFKIATFFPIVTSPDNIRTNLITGKAETYSICHHQKFLGIWEEGIEVPAIYIVPDYNSMRDYWIVNRGFNFQRNYCLVNKAQEEDWNAVKCEWFVLIGEIITSILSGGTSIAAKGGLMAVKRAMIELTIDTAFGGLSSVCHWLFKGEHYWPHSQCDGCEV